MRKSVYMEWLEKYLGDLARGAADKKYENPAVDFTRRAKAGEYDALTDPQYAALLAETEELSLAWLSGRERRSADLLGSFMEQSRLDQAAIHQIAALIAAGYRGDGAFTDEAAVGQPGASRPREEGSLLVASWQPRQIYNHLAGCICGQRQALRAASMLLYNHLRGRKRNLLFAGPTGCGKTEIWRVLQKLYPHIRIVDSSIITLQGWAGSFKVRDIFSGMDRETAEKSIIVFDEFDKLCEPKYGSDGVNYSSSSQNELLKLIEGSRIVFPEDRGRSALEFDSSKISFVFCGSFEYLLQSKAKSQAEPGLGFGRSAGSPDAHALYRDDITPEDLVRYAGIRQEIAGRIQQIVQLYPMTRADYETILDDRKISPLYRLERQYGVKLSLDAKTRTQLLDRTVDSRMGVRYLKNQLQQLLDNAMFQDCGRREYCLQAGPIYT